MATSNKKQANESANVVSNATMANVEVMKKADAKRIINTEFDKEFNSPFAFINFFNKHRNELGFADYANRFGFGGRKMELSDLFGIPNKDDASKTDFCKLSGIVPEGVEPLGAFLDKNEKVWYYIPIKFKRSDVFASIESKVNLAKKIEVLRKFETNKDAVEKAKARRVAINAKIEELRKMSEFSAMDDNQLRKVASAIVGK